jgi:hypothetical protein
MSATFMCNEKLAVTVKFTVIETDLVIIVIAMESQFKFIESEAGPVFRIPFCLLDLAN